MAGSNDGKPWFRVVKNCWYLWHDGRQVSLRVKGKENHKQAYAAWLRLLAGEPPSTASPCKVAVVRVQAVVDGFLADVTARAKPSTIEVYTHFLDLFAKKFGKRQAESLKPFEVECFARKPKWTSSSRNTIIGMVVTAFRWAVRAGLLAKNPLEGISKPPKQSRGRKAVISLEEHNRMLAASNPALRRLLIVLWETGCRPSEAYRLTAGDVDLAKGVAVLVEHKTDQSGLPRVIVLSPIAIQIFSELIATHPTGALLRKLNGGKWSVDSLNFMMRETRKRAGVPNVTAYGYRHSFATDALSSGVPDATVAALLGHSGTAMLFKHYSHLTSRVDVLKAGLGKVRG